MESSRSFPFLLSPSPPLCSISPKKPFDPGINQLCHFKKEKFKVLVEGLEPFFICENFLISFFFSFFLFERMSAVKSFQDKEKPAQVRQSNIIAAKGTGLYRTGISFSVLTREMIF